MLGHLGRLVHPQDVVADLTLPTLIGASTLARDADLAQGAVRSAWPRAWHRLGGLGMLDSGS